MAETTEKTGGSLLSVRLTAQERADLEKAAAGWPLSAYVRAKLFSDTGGSQPLAKPRGKFPVKDHQALGRVLGSLGRSRIANNLNQLAYAANSGSLPVNDNVQQELLHACEEVRAMRADLLAALGDNPKRGRRRA